MIISIFLACPGQPYGSEAEQEYFLIGVSSRLLPNLDIKDAHAAMEVWLNEFAFKSGITKTSKVIIFSDLHTIHAAIKTGQLDMIALHTLDYLRIKDKVQIDPILLSTYESDVLLVHKNQGIQSIEHLRGKKLLIQSGVAGEVSLMWLDSNLRKKNLPKSKRFFQSIKDVPKASNAVLQVFFKQSDACIVNRKSFETMVEQNPQLGESLMVISSSSSFAKGTFGIIKGFDAGMKNKLIQEASNMHQHSSGRQILMLFHISGLSPFNPSHINNLNILLQEKSSLSHAAEKKR